MLILASGSPRRARLLKEAGVVFRVVVPETEETVLPDDPPGTARRNAGAKLAWCRARYPESRVIAADTVIGFDGGCLVKPASREEAFAFLRRFSGKEQSVFTAVAMASAGGKVRVETVESGVRFRNLTAALITDYFQRVDPLDKAGGYDIDQYGELIIESYSGSWTNIMGLPMEVVTRWLSNAELGTRNLEPGTWIPVVHTAFAPLSPAATHSAPLPPAPQPADGFSGPRSTFRVPSSEFRVSPVQPLQLGALTVEFPFVLAPMAGYTDPSIRVLCRRHGCGMTFTEVVNAQGLLHGSRLTMHLLEVWPGERPVGAHIYGRDPGEMAAAAVLIERLGRFDFIDVNCGCPVRKIVAKGCGAALMAEPERIGRVVAAMSQAVALPVTVKTRIGLSPERRNISEIAQAVEEAGGRAIFIHARYASQRHSGRADWETLAGIKRERSIPVVGNGGVQVAADAVEMLRQTGVDGVMIGRAAIGNPWIFEDIGHIVAGSGCRLRSRGELREAIVEQLEIMEALHEKARRGRRKGKEGAAESAALHFRGHLHQYLKGLPGWGEVRRGLQTMNSKEKILLAVDALLARQIEREQDGHGQKTVVGDGC